MRQARLQAFPASTGALASLLVAKRSLVSLHQMLPVKTGSITSLISIEIVMKKTNALCGMNYRLLRLIVTTSCFLNMVIIAPSSSAYSKKTAISPTNACAKKSSYEECLECCIIRSRRLSSAEGVKKCAMVRSGESQAIFSRDEVDALCEWNSKVSIDDCAKDCKQKE